MLKSQYAASQYEYWQVWQRIALQATDAASTNAAPLVGEAQNSYVSEPTGPYALIPGANVTQGGGNVTAALSKLNRGQMFDDLGATGTTTYQLPTDAVLGDVFFYNVVTTQTTKVDPGSAGTIQLAASGGSAGTAGTAGQKATCAGIAGASLTVVCVGTTGSAGGCEWQVVHGAGTWTLGS